MQVLIGLNTKAICRIRANRMDLEKTRDANLSLQNKLTI